MNQTKYQNLYLLFFGIIMALIAGCFNEPANSGNQNPVELQVYKSPTCGCCGAWIEHLGREGFHSKVFHPEDLNGVKAQYGIKPEYQSCHTAVSEQGYIFEGHVPARFIKAFLANPPEGASGLSVPGMPLGSPGMETSDQFTPYQVLLLKKDGSSEVYAHIDSIDQQFAEPK